MTAELPGTAGAGRCHLTSRQKPFRADERDCNSSVCTGLCFRSALGWLSAGWAWRGNSCLSLGWPQHCRDWELCTIIQLSFHFQQKKKEWIQNTQVEKNVLQALYFLLDASRRVSDRGESTMNTAPSTCKGSFRAKLSNHHLKNMAWCSAQPRCSPRYLPSYVLLWLLLWWKSQQQQINSQRQWLSSTRRWLLLS